MTRRVLRALAATGLAMVATGMMASASDFSAPTIDNSQGRAIQPWIVSPGQVITITGSHFSSDANPGNCQLHGAPTVRFRPLDGSPEVTSRPATDAASCTNSMLKVQVPGGFTGGANVVVTDYRNQSTNSGSSGFVPQVTIQPSAALSPGSGGVGTSGISITGGKFRPLNAVASSFKLTYNGAGKAFSSWANDSIQFAPGNASGAVRGEFQVTTDANNPGTNLQTVSFDAGTYTFRPPSVQGGAVNGQTVDSTISIPGSNLGSSRGTVTFPGAAARQANTWSDSGLTITVPPGAQSGAVTVQVPSFGSINGPTVQIIPVVKSMTPTSGSGGTLVRASGYNFGGTAGSVSIGGAPQQVTTWNDTTVAFILSGDTDTGNTVITRPDGASATAPDLKIVPHLTHLDGDNQPVGGQVVASGVSLGSEQGSVTIGGVTAAPLLWSRTSVLVAIPDGVPVGKAPLVVTSAAGVASNPLSLTVAAGQAAPTPGTVAADGTPVTPGASAPIVFDENHTFVKPVKPASPVQLVLTASPHDSPAGGVADLTVKLTLNGKPVNGAAIRLSMLLSPDKDYAFTPDNGTTDADGVFKAKVKISAKGGENVILAESGIFSDQDHVKGAGAELVVPGVSSNPASASGAALPFVALSAVGAAFVCGGIFFNLRTMRLLAP
ncbi:MAG: hypothetical protein QOE92_1794 [Chloroflexota bacterium]|nr:hypothetical protein [Chloroflexota bacterium]